MKELEEARIAICTAPPGLYAVINSTEKQVDSDIAHTVQVVTAFKYTYFDEGAEEIFSEPLVYCESKGANALVDGKSRIEFVGTYENCILKIKELITAHYIEKTANKKQG